MEENRHLRGDCDGQHDQPLSCYAWLGMAYQGLPFSWGIILLD